METCLQKSLVTWLELPERPAYRAKLRFPVIRMREADFRKSASQVNRLENNPRDNTSPANTYFPKRKIMYLHLYIFFNCQFVMSLFRLSKPRILRKKLGITYSSTVSLFISMNHRLDHDYIQYHFYLSTWNTHSRPTRGGVLKRHL